MSQAGEVAVRAAAAGRAWWRVRGFRSGI